MFVIFCFVFGCLGTLIQVGIAAVKMDQLLDMEQLNKLTPDQQEKVIQGVRQQAAIAHAQSLISVSFVHCKLLEF